MAVFVLDRRGKPLMPCSEGRARKLLNAARARIHRIYPFTIRLVDRTQEESCLQPMRLSIDPGSKATGIALSRVEPHDDARVRKVAGPRLHVSFAMELTHRSRSVRAAVKSRADNRKSRRSRRLRYRACRFDNRVHQPGWLAPSLQHRADSTMTWVRRLKRVAPITEVSQELQRFDLATVKSPQTEPFDWRLQTQPSFELWEYLLAKWSRTCAVCDKREVRLFRCLLNPRHQGGDVRVNNMTLLCERCVGRKGDRTIEAFLSKRPELLRRIQMKARFPLQAAEYVSAVRLVIKKRIEAEGLPVSVGSGGGTKWNRVRMGIPRTYASDAVCVGEVGDVRFATRKTLHVRSHGRGSRSRTLLNSSGFPRAFKMRRKTVFGFRTGDMVRAVVAQGARAGTHVGRVAVSAAGRFAIQTKNGLVDGIGHRNCVLVARGDGYSYALGA